MSEATRAKEFDFGAHAGTAVERYRMVRPDYELLAEVAKRLLIEMLRASGIRIHSVEARAKSLESFEKKVAKPSDYDPRKPKYEVALREITDLAHS
jgi:putative GTP pyrophosphokinase